MKARNWQMDRRISLGLIAALLLQAGSAIWWAAGKEQQDRFQDSRLVQAEAAMIRQSGDQALIAERLARIEARMESQIEILKNIEKRLGRD
ncbi:MAG: hypothetical protein WDO70_04235 [Alphaproteobacteria bacterium]